ncbi:uncharacterized protein LOC130702741 [Daphnia carinata]|uniref:uncharacterized protein LOC130702741 n=1 Tax=Daphnia carinata TaxID=120202 RepID=UPI00257B6558|nr:uncharacterized protein LOC130702741 [Daphnia carinata]
MKFSFILLLFFSYWHPSLCVIDDLPKFRVVCTVSDAPVPLQEPEDVLLDEVCSDVLYRISYKTRNSYRRNSLNSSDSVSRFRQRHPKLPLQISIHDFLLEDTPSTGATSLITLLKKMNATGLDVIVNPKTNLAVLSQVLSNYQQTLFANSLGLSVTIGSSLNISSIIQHGIDVLVDNLFLVPNDLANIDHEEFNLTIVNALPKDKLVMGFPSVVFKIPHSQDRFSIPSVAELCQDSNLKQWKPKIEDDDQVIWSHAEKPWKFSMKMGRAVTKQLSKIANNSLRTGILLFDVSFRLERNPICFRHRALFIDSLRQAARKLGYATEGQRVKRAQEEPISSVARPGMKLTGKGNRLGKILIFAVGDEDEQFRKYYSVHDEDTFLDSPVDNVVLGYDDGGKIYDIYQQMPRELSQQSIFNTIHQYFVDKILGGGGGNIFGAVQVHPPNILVYPDAVAEHPVPILVTWVRVASPIVRLLPRKTRKQSSTSTTSTTSIPSTTPQMCSGSPQRCIIPVSLMETLDLRSPPHTTTTTRKSTTMRQTTMKPLVPVNPHARLSNQANANVELTEGEAHETTTPSPPALNFTLVPVANSEEPKQGRMSYSSEQHILCNWKSANSYLFCKNRN